MARKPRTTPNQPSSTNRQGPLVRRQTGTKGPITGNRTSTTGPVSPFSLSKGRSRGVRASRKGFGR